MNSSFKVNKEKQRKLDETLLLEVQKHSNLYDTKSKLFKDIGKRHSSWQLIATLLQGMLF